MAYAEQKIEDLLDLPEMEDVKQRKICELLARLCCVAMASFPELYSFIIIKPAIMHSGMETMKSPTSGILDTASLRGPYLATTWRAKGMLMSASGLQRNTAEAHPGASYTSLWDL